MTESASREILRYIAMSAEPGTPVVVELDELKSAAGEEIAAADVKELAMNGCIALKYSDGKSFCVALTEKGLDLSARTPEETAPARGKLRDVSPKKIFLTGFLGGVSGGIAVLAIILALFYLITNID